MAPKPKATQKHEASDRALVHTAPLPRPCIWYRSGRASQPQDCWLLGFTGERLAVVALPDGRLRTVLVKEVRVPDLPVLPETQS